MGAFAVLLTLVLLLALALGCTALVLVAIVLSLAPPEPEDRHERQSGQSVRRGPRRDSEVTWPEQHLQRVPASLLHPRRRPR
jgi:hypothetical protein